MGDKTKLSIAHGVPLSQQPGIGPLTIGGYLREVAAHYGAGEGVPLGMVGEFCVKGPTLMSGYLGKAPEECFDDEGFYHTGDGGYLDEAGRFFWSGRLTDTIKTGGRM